MLLIRGFFTVAQGQLVSAGRPSAHWCSYSTTLTTSSSDNIPATIFLRPLQPIHPDNTLLEVQGNIWFPFDTPIILAHSHQKVHPDRRGNLVGATPPQLIYGEARAVDPIEFDLPGHDGWSLAAVEEILLDHPHEWLIRWMFDDSWTHGPEPEINRPFNFQGTFLGVTEGAVLRLNLQSVTLPGPDELPTDHDLLSPSCVFRENGARHQVGRQERVCFNE